MTPRGPSRDPLVGEGSRSRHRNTAKRGRITPEESTMQQAKTSFETGVAQCDTGEWCWAARGRDLPEFFRSCDPSYVPTSTGWFVFGPYTTEGAARRELREFVDEFFRDAATYGSVRGALSNERPYRDLR